MTTRLRAFAVFFSAMSILFSCSGGGGSPSNVESPPVATPGNFSGRALLGPLVNADVKLFSLSDVGRPLAEVKTVNSADLSAAGAFWLTTDNLVPDEVYLVTASGGVDIDQNDDGVTDTPLTNAATLHALVPGRFLLARTPFNISLATELLYQRLRLLLASGERAPDILLREVEFRAQQLLTQDVTGDATINIDDVLQWDPLRHKAALHATTEMQRLVSDKLRAGESIASYAIEWMSKTIAASESSVSTDIVLAGSFLYSADIERGLIIYDLSRPDALREVSATLFPHNDPDGVSPAWGLTGIVVDQAKLNAVAIYNTAAGTIHSALLTIDVSDPRQPRLVATLSLAPSQFLIKPLMHNGVLLAMVNDTSSYVAVYDLRNPTQPVRLPDIAASSSVIRDIAMHGDSVLVATDQSLFAYDIRDPAKAKLTMTTPGAFAALAVHEDVLFNVNDGIDLYRLNTGATLTPLSHVDAPPGVIGRDFYFGRPVIAGTKFIVGASDAGLGSAGDLQQFDFSDPVNPRFLGLLATSTAPRKVIYFAGNLITINAPGKIKIVTTDIVESSQFNGALNLADGNSSMLSDDHFIYHFDINQLHTLSLPALGDVSAQATNLMVPLRHNVESVVIRGDTILFSGRQNLLDIYRVDSQGGGILLASVVTADTWNVAELIVVEQSAWVIARRRTDANFVLLNIDISNLANPVIVSEASLNKSRVSYAGRVGSVLYVQYGGTISIFDASNPAAPQLTGTLATMAYPVAFTVKDQKILVITSASDDAQNTHDGAIEIFDAAVDALKPVQLSRVVLANSVRFGSGLWKYAVAAHADVLYVAFGEKGTFAVDLSDPRQPQLLGQLDSIGPAASVIVTPENVVTVLDSTGHLNLYTGVTQTAPTRIE